MSRRTVVLISACFLLLSGLGFTLAKPTEILHPQESLSLETTSVSSSPQQQVPPPALLAPSNPADVNFRKYLGLWYAEDDPGTTVWLGYSSTGEKLIRVNTSSPKVASFETVLEVRNEKTGNFAFGNDGWNNQGHGTVSFFPDKLVVDIVFDALGKWNWGTFSGTRVFVRAPWRGPGV